MKVFFSASPRGGENFGKYYQIIANELKKLSYTSVDDDVIQIEYSNFSKKMSEGQENLIEYAKKKMSAVNEADICIFETSLPSLGVGFLVQKSLDAGKPTIVLYYKENIPFIISGIEDEKLVVRSYNDNNLKKILAESLEYARERRDKRFNFFINPKLLEYLERVSKEDCITKSKFIRNLILDHMRKPQ